MLSNTVHPIIAYTLLHHNAPLFMFTLLIALYQSTYAYTLITVGFGLSSTREKGISGVGCNQFFSS